MTSATWWKPQQLEHLVGEPARMAELEAVAARGQRVERVRELPDVRLLAPGSCHSTGPSLGELASGAIAS